MKGTIKAINIVEPKKGMRICFYSTVYKRYYVGTIKNPKFFNNPQIVCTIDWGDERTNFSISETKNLENLKQLVIEYEIPQFSNYNDEKVTESPKIVQLPLDTNSWQHVLDQNLIDKEVEFEIVDITKQTTYDQPDKVVGEIAKIIIQQPKMYSEEQAKEREKLAFNAGRDWLSMAYQGAVAYKFKDFEHWKENK